ncbi:MAG: hypothetical protein SFW64_00350 [Alphaproteobacteria bacterium]|nr:hypothetical protein [Alphaproteobacteria bacterium]
MHARFDANDLTRVHSELFTNLRDVFGESFDSERFNRLVSQWNREGRLFHGAMHLYAMAERDHSLPGSAPNYAMVSGFFHDIEYPSIGEETNDTSCRFIDTYIDRSKNKLKPLAEDDRVGRLLYAIFGFAEGDTLSPVAGMNEFYSAAVAVGELKQSHKDEAFIAAVIAGIQATVPFGKPDRMDQLRGRLEAASRSEGLDLNANAIDEMMIAATYLANKDVSGFIGGLDVHNDTAPSIQSVLETIRGGDMLNPEEVPSMRVRNKSPETPLGDYTPADFLKARLRRAGLYQLVLKGNSETQSIDNIFFETRLSAGNIYPPQDWVKKASHLAYLNNEPVRLTEYARLISQALVYSLAAAGGDATEPTKVKQGDLVSGIDVLLKLRPPENASEVRQLAFNAVNGRHQINGGDTQHSPVAKLILSTLNESQITELALAARASLFPEPNPTEFLAQAKRVLGNQVIVVRDAMVQAVAQSGNQAMSQALRKIALSDPSLPPH